MDEDDDEDDALSSEAAVGPDRLAPIFICGRGTLSSLG